MNTADGVTLRDQYENGLPGWRPDHDGIEDFLATLARPTLVEAAPQLMAAEKRDAFLWEPLLSLHPHWKRGAQGIGDCVSWGWELGALLTMCADIVFRQEAECFAGEIATEPIYGGSRVEARGGRLAGYSDGSYGAAAARWVKEWGVLLRKNYAGETQNADHDLSTYSAKRAKEWGNFGCGGSRDSRGDGPLDKLAREHPVTEVALVRTVEEAAAALSAFKPVVVCSNVGYGAMRRNAEGIVRAQGSWSHCMLFGGVKWTSAGPLLRQFQSWGQSASGPDPDIAHEAVSWCSWWTRPEDADRQLRQGDSFALAGLTGWAKPKHDHVLA